MPMVRVSNGGTALTSIASQGGNTNSQTYTASTKCTVVVCSSTLAFDRTTITLNGADVRAALPQVTATIDGSGATLFLCNMNVGDVLVASVTSNYRITLIILS